MIEMFLDDPKFPFFDYYCDADSYIRAQRYWLLLLRSLPQYSEGEWAPVMRPVDVKDDQSSGLVFWIRNAVDKKEIILHTGSFEGFVHQYMVDNGGYTDEEVEQFAKDFNYHPSEAEKRGLTWDEAEKDARLMYEDFLVWVEDAIYFHHDASHPEGGVEVPVERLILTSEISERAEPLATRALELFLQKGPAKERVNRVFSSDPQA
ncbi:hypothetical protein EKK97_10245 [Billgrantia tianxiuensis]|jgi:hypothetical protein|uniref:Uncharacterized protein n=1 Tax=Billgrantia tianxiuensis TaxID=2497861 RepID=A0A6I6SSX7_9GAMM|nr:MULTISPECIES: hypothetical protein [Halomonas]MCE8032047.1 hypothetical protein [Halomonas sp. MCCC 1A11057]QHC49913.1 hypothetical protein EKK97_10245 [Halomonas tianxiuensis]